MEYLTKDKFLEKVNLLKEINPEHWGHTERIVAQPISIERWDYHEKAIEIIKSIKPKSILEAGSMGIELSKDSDTIDFDLPEFGWRLTYSPTYIHDLRIVPWDKIKDKQYDIFVALRVFHHMDSQYKYLKEMNRISKHIILALTNDSANKYELIKKADKRYNFNNTDTAILYYKV